MSRRRPVSVIYEDNHLIAVIKPAGVLVHGDSTGDPTLGDSVKQYIKDRYNKPGDVFLGTIHRLDRPVSGVVVFARTSKALSRMNAMLRDHKITKIYHSVVSGRLPEFQGKLVHHIAKDSDKNFVRAFTRSKKGTKEATTHYEVLGEVSGLTKVKLTPITGRPHQLRVQMAKVGCPIVGDVKYGSDRPMDDLSLCLHCSEMSFQHPVKLEPIRITAATPDKLYWDFF